MSEFWSNSVQRKKFSYLLTFALKVYSISAISDTAKHLFSDSRRIIDWSRMSLGADTLKKTESIKSWSHSGFEITAILNL